MLSNDRLVCGHNSYRPPFLVEGQQTHQDDHGNQDYSCCWAQRVVHFVVHRLDDVHADTQNRGSWKT